ncbi:Acetyltransferase, GNAT family [Mycetohabitans rhizoxinica HKI 454]|uniref:Acetyltransferase, GNAT family n=1 Tax=Mycetohabitans rhizoxinica (strain DSM 19002 / CIP 109453 / HKI 454) TaxID=882378 RepID=E5AP00_MYCRK|nr:MULTISPECIES: GNAT family N-acetyltransferase [Mycetohabitans]MCG1046561.1 GNAT family N-acetyltransferase [Mycetohabitans sp. B6]CBW74332.1 Acetyltransferase, GNAT family [Mycetohabitans rhizoxinica HKI 454]
MIEWSFRHFAELSAADVYDMLDVRSEVFVVEQRCIYRDIDQLDWQAWHLFARDTRLPGCPCAGYLRVLSAAQHDERADRVIGRVLTSPRHRGDGLGRALMAQALDHIGSRWPNTAVRLHAQAHLQRFYRGFGFEPISDEHDDDGIAHVWMRRP